MALLLSGSWRVANFSVRIMVIPWSCEVSMGFCAQWPFGKCHLTFEGNGGGLFVAVWQLVCYYAADRASACILIGLRP